MRVVLRENKTWEERNIRAVSLYTQGYKERQCLPSLGLGQHRIEDASHVARMPKMKGLVYD